MRRIIAAAALSIAVAGCQERATDARGENPAVSIRAGDGAGVPAEAGKLAIDVPGLQAKIDLPGFMIRNADFDIDGLALAPDTKVTAIDVDADGSNGGLTLRFANPQAPAALIDHYRRSAIDAGFQVAAAAATGLRLTKTGDRVSIDVAPEGTGSRGTIAVVER